MQTPQAAEALHSRQTQINSLVARHALTLWNQLGLDFSAEWPSVKQTLVDVVSAGQLAVAATAAGYVDQVLDETDQPPAPAAGVVNPYAWVGAGPSGIPVDTLLDTSIIDTKHAIAGGAPAPSGLQLGGRGLVRNVMTTLQDTGRGFVAADITARPRVGGYTRMLNPPSCSRCIMLAGKWYRWNKGFQRHPRCDCKMIACSENVAGDLTTDPYTYFHSLDRDAQDNLFGANDAQALRDGGDIYRIMNIRARGLSDGKTVQARFWHTPTRMTIDDIYTQAGDNRALAVGLMRREGYILPGGQVAGGVLRGNSYVGMSKATVSLHEHAAAVGFGHTAAEQRVSTAYTNFQELVAGRNPYRNQSNAPVTSEMVRAARRDLDTAIDRLLGNWH